LAKDGHRDARADVERRKEGAAGAAGVVERDAADAVPGTPNVECPIDIARLDRVARTGGEHERVFLSADARLPVGRAGVILVALRDPQRRHADRR